MIHKDRSLAISGDRKLASSTGQASSASENFEPAPPTRPRTLVSDLDLHVNMEEWLELMDAGGNRLVCSDAFSTMPGAVAEEDCTVQSYQAEDPHAEERQVEDHLIPSSAESSPSLAAFRAITGLNFSPRNLLEGKSANFLACGTDWVDNKQSLGNPVLTCSPVQTSAVPEHPVPEGFMKWWSIQFRRLPSLRRL